jgi:signal transduction histidine kinase
MNIPALAAWRKGRQSIRTQLIFGTIVGLTLALALFGFFVRYVVATTLMNAVDRNLQDRIIQEQHRPPFHMGPGGPYGLQLQLGPGPNDHNPNNAPPFQSGRQQNMQPPPNDMQMGAGQQGPPQSNFRPVDNLQTRHDGNQFEGYAGRNSGPGTTGWMPDNNAPSPDNTMPPSQRFPEQSDRQEMPQVKGVTEISQQDLLYHPRRFLLNGQSFDRFSTMAAWDTAAIRRAARQNGPVLSTVVVGKIPLRIFTQPVHPPVGPVWFLQAASPLTETIRAVDGVDRALLTLIPIALLIAGIGGAFLTTRVLSRVKQMAQAAATIGAKDLSRRLPVVGNDEFAGLAETFNELLARVEIAFQEQARVVEQQRRFTADASHELKTPLTLIRGTTSLALSDNGILDRQSTIDIDNAAASMSELVQDLIFLARADAGQLGKKRIDLLLLDPLQRAVDLISPISEAPINFMQAHECLSVNADESDMTRLFSNILQNAAYHTPSGGRIIVSLSSTLTDAIVMINDSGVGIAPQHVEHLGERFYRVDSSRTRSSEIIGGSGLGLAICIGIVEAHGGTMKIDSILGKGTTVTITLPRVNVIAG